MIVSLNWLKDYVDINEEPKEFSEKLTMSGTKVEGFEVLGNDIENVVVGKIIKTEKHPDADKLTICTIDIGKEEPVIIVTGAQNIFEGAYVPAALHNSKLPGGINIKASKLRGVMSYGMLCSIAELNLTTHDCPEAIEDGIYILDDSHAPGTDIKEALMLNDTAVELELTFNRPDCLALTSIARESAAALKTEFKAPKMYKIPEGNEINDYLHVKVENTTLCPRYTAAVVKNVKIGPSPLWLRRRLRTAGVRPINNIVDITNYVMLEYGQPMHAFDYEFLKSKQIIVRNAKEGEKITTLDSVVHELNKDMLCIADGEKPVALAGVMGGENSEINDNTVTVVFESANFDRSSIRRTARALGMRTESSNKFEKGLPAYNTYPALMRALELTEMLGAGEVVSGVIDVLNTDIGERRIPFDIERINALIGINLSSDEAASLLKPLDLIVDGKELIVPPYRYDMEKTADITEEIARLYGFDNIPSTQFSGSIEEGGYTAKQKFRLDAEDRAAAMGFCQVYTYSFISPKAYDMLCIPKDSEKRKSITLLNPLGEENSVMRTTALASVLEVMAYNANRKAENIMLFENATVYEPAEDGMSKERKQLILSFGKCADYDFYSMKGFVESIFDALRVDVSKIYASSDCSFHPGRQATIELNGKAVAVFGQINPVVAENLALPVNTYAAVIELDAIFEERKIEKSFKKLPAFPAIERDLALIANDEVECGTIIATIENAGVKTLESVKVFDVYKGKGVEEGKKSIAFRITFRHSEKTLNDEEADKATQKILKKLSSDLGIELRR